MPPRAPPGNTRETGPGGNRGRGNLESDREQQEIAESSVRRKPAASRLLPAGSRRGGRGDDGGRVF